MDNGGAGGGLLSQPVSAFLYCHLVPWDNFIPSPLFLTRLGSWHAQGVAFFFLFYLCVCINLSGSAWSSLPISDGQFRGLGST